MLLVFMLAGGLAFFSSQQVAHAQSDCIDPATGAACTPVPPGPTCGVPGTPPCEPPPPPPPTSPPSGCTDAAGNACTPVPPPSNPDPTRTPKPRPTNTPLPTATFTTTPTTYFIMPKETATPTPLGMATATNQYIFPKTTPTSLVEIPAPFILPPKPVTPKSQQSPWGGFIDQFIKWVNSLFPGKSSSIVLKDLLWLNKVNVVDGEYKYCMGGPMCPNMETRYPYDNIKVIIMPEGVVAPKVIEGKEEDFYPALCLGSTGEDGCLNPVLGYRFSPEEQASWSWSLNNYFFQNYGKSLPGVYVFDIPKNWIKGPGNYLLTAYVNFNQQAFLENYDNNFITFSFKITGDTSIAKALPTATPIPDNQFYFENKVVVLQDENCVLGCAVTTNGWINAGRPVEVYTIGLGSPSVINGITSYKYVGNPAAAAMFFCKGATGLNGCASPSPADLPPYTLPQWFTDSPDAKLLSNQPGIVRFTVPGNQISSPGIYKFTFYVNYQQQAAPEKNMIDNTKTIYLNAVAQQQ